MRVMEDGRQTAHLLQLQGSWGCLSLWDMRKVAHQTPSNAWLEDALHVAAAATMASTVYAICCSDAKYVYFVFALAKGRLLGRVRVAAVGVLVLLFPDVGRLQ